MPTHSLFPPQTRSPTSWSGNLTLVFRYSKFFSAISKSHPAVQTEFQAALENHVGPNEEYAAGEPVQHAPDPGLSIEGLPNFQLPIRKRDAKLIKRIATRATVIEDGIEVVDTDQRRTWQIEPTKVAFTNPSWDAFIKDTILLVALRKLGLSSPFLTPLKCELNALLLHKISSQCV